MRIFHLKAVEERFVKTCFSQTDPVILLLTEMLNRSISSLRCHSTFKSTNLLKNRPTESALFFLARSKRINSMTYDEASTLKSERNEIKE